MSARAAGHHGETPSETLARFIVEHALGVRVCCHDDRRGISRPDGVIHRRGGVPLEIVSDPLKSDHQLINALNKIENRSEFDGLTRGYRVCLSGAARVKDLGWLHQTLRRLEDPETHSQVPRRSDQYLFIAPDARLPPGHVRFTTGSGGVRPIPKPPDVVEAATAVLSRAEYADVARKLDAFGGVERHAVLIGDDENDYRFSWLREASPANVGQLPTPDLTPSVTHLWIMPRYIPGLTIVWSAATGWQGTAWDWGHPPDALETWNDPVCPENHGAGAFRTA